MIENGPIPAIHGVMRWRLVDLCQWVFEEFRIHIAPQTMSRELHAMDYRKLFARPRHYAHAIMPKQIPTLDACSKLPRDAE
jgi:Winged helix-turn helix